METTRKKPYGRAKCELLNYGKNAVMFTSSWTDRGGLSPTGEMAYESFKRSVEYAATHPTEAYSGPDSRYIGKRYSVFKDPLYDDYQTEPNTCGNIPVFVGGLLYVSGWDILDNPYPGDLERAQSIASLSRAQFSNWLCGYGSNYGIPVVNFWGSIHYYGGCSYCC